MTEDEFLAPGQVVLVMHAHPDDEVFASGGAVIAAAAAGARVHLRVFTGGEGRDVADSDAALTAARVRKEAKLDQSARLLGFQDWGYVSSPGVWIDAPHLPARTMAQADVADLARAAASVIDELRPDVVLTVGPDGLTGHPDHVACYKAVARSLGLVAHPPTTVLGAVLDEHDVKTAQAAAASIFTHPIGSGGVQGMPRTRGWIQVPAEPFGESRRRAALDAYAPGLGTAATQDLPSRVSSRGDSLLLRLVLDQAGWDRDWYVPISPAPGA